MITCLSAAGSATAQERLPNVVIVLTDDQGYEDLGSYGATGFETPHLDRLAQEGIRFTSFYVENACSPTRAALMTGSYPVRVGFPGVLGPRSTRGLNTRETTIAEVLSDRGYATAAVGKWHLGDHPEFLPTNHGFDEYFGLPYSNDMSPDSANNPRPRARRHPPLPLLRDTTVVEREPDQSQLTQRYTDEAVRFIEEHADEPFFLYLAHSFPHVPLYASERFRGSTRRGLYGDVIAEIDASVGRLMDVLEANNLTNNTLFVFLSDNGPWLVFGEHGGSAGSLREGKATTFEGGHRVPAIARWPGTIPGDVVSGEIYSAMDLLPTIAAVAGANSPDGIDGENLLPYWKDGAVESPRETFYFFRQGELQAVRSGRWKLHLPHEYIFVDTPGAGGMPGTFGRRQIGTALFDMKTDSTESHDVASEHPDVVRRLLELAEEARRDLGDALTDRVGAGTRPVGTVAEPWYKQQPTTRSPESSSEH